MAWHTLGIEPESVKPFTLSNNLRLFELTVITVIFFYPQPIKDFGSIFSTLLPGSNAKLAPPEGMSVLDGLEVKVAFGSVWKESLTELSGGQRYE